MNDATREQLEAAGGGARFEALFNKSSMVDKLIIKALAGLTVMTGSNLDRDIKFDAMKAIVEMTVSGGQYHALDALRKCSKETEAPLEVIHSVMALNTLDDLHRSELRFNTMMQLFVEEAERRRGG